MNILLIEDELLAMDELRHLMKPYEREHAIVGFDNGEDALAYTRHRPPDIVVSDIRMPGINGLEVVRQILSVHPRTQIILLSGYNDFEYARTALKLGAREYLLKPVTEAELEAAMSRALEAVRAEEAKSRNELRWSLSRLLGGIDSPEERGGGPPIDGPWLMVAMLLENWNSPFTWAQSGVTAAATGDWLRSSGVHPEAACFDMDGHLRVVLVPAGERDRSESLRRTALTIHEYHLRSAGIVHTVYERKGDNENADDAYRRCLERLEAQVRLGEPTFMSAGGSGSEQAFWDSARRIEQHIRNREYGKLDLELRRLLDGLRLNRSTLRHTSVLLSDFLYALKFKMENGSDPDAVSAGFIYEYLRTCATDERLLGWLKERLAALMAGIDRGMPQPKQMIPALLEYVQANYGETIHLQDFASRHHVSVGYLSKLFKAETGTHFSDYLIRLRMNKAMELLDGGYRRIAEIGRLVGYEDPKFFSQTFKRYAGVTPQEYKRKEK